MYLNPVNPIGVNVKVCVHACKWVACIEGQSGWVAHIEGQSGCMAYIGGQVAHREAVWMGGMHRGVSGT